MNATEVDEIALARRLLKLGTGRGLREQLGLTMAEFGQALEPPVSAATICRWESGVHRPRGQAARNYLAAVRRLRESESALDGLEVQ